LGGGGHTSEWLRLVGPTGRVYAIDQDETAIDNARHRFEGVPNLVLLKGNFRNLKSLLASAGVNAVDRVFFDLGVSSPQFDEGERGFSYRFDAPLDMRMDLDEPLTAEKIVNTWSHSELARVIDEYGEERFAGRVSSAIVAHRPISTTGQLAEIIKSAIPAAARRTGPHPARRTFQALRIAVNDELGALKAALEDSLLVLSPGGRVGVITFHSLEDRIVKQFFVAKARGCICPPRQPVCTCGHKPEVRLITRKPVSPDEGEIENNPRSRSARLRVAEKIGVVLVDEGGSIPC
jgi:16S rRNA (cytosine1402-N4)-methyltransferase